MWIDQGQCSVGGFNWSELPVEIKVEILCRLPRKPLIRFKCVSKSWYLLISKDCAPRISSPSLSATFYGCIYYRDYERSEKRLRFRFSEEFRTELTGFRKLLSSRLRRKSARIKDCCNGLLLVTPAAASLEYYVFNHTTRECIAIPIDPHERKVPSFSSLAFDPRDSAVSFKIVLTEIDPLLSNTLKLCIFSSESWNWAPYMVPLEGSVQSSQLTTPTTTVYLNGILYVLSRFHFLVGIRITVTKTENITCQTIELPGKDEFKCRKREWLGTSRGFLLYSDADQSKILVWLLKDGVHWFIQHRITRDEIIPHFPQDLHDWTEAYGFHPLSDEVFVGSLFLVHRYNPKTKKMKEFIPFRGEENRLVIPRNHRLLPLSCCAVTLNPVMFKSEIAMVP